MLELKIKLDLFLGISSIRPHVVTAGAYGKVVSLRAAAEDQLAFKQNHICKWPSSLKSNNSQQTLPTGFLSQIWEASVFHTPL